MRKASDLLVESLAPSSRKYYSNALKNYGIFARDYLQRGYFPARIQDIAVYIAYLVDKGWAPSTITANISAISYFHKLMDVQDPTSSFLIRKILAGATKLSKSPDMRIPISINMLRSLLQSTQFIASSTYECLLLRAMYTLMFFGFMRIGEVTKSVNNIQFSQVSISKSSLSITFEKFKHHVGSPIVITIPASGSVFCPVKVTSDYIIRRGSSPGPFFCTPGSIPILPSKFYSCLRASLIWAGISHLNIKPHSFRIGAATWAASCGYSDCQIQTMGRWNSYAFKKYIRITSFRLAL